jgi:hypothetical protein
MRLRRFLPILLGTYPILALYAHNQSELSLHAIVVPMLIALGIGGAIWVVLHLLVRTEHRVTLWMLILLLWLWTGGLSYGLLQRSIADFDWELVSVLCSIPVLLLLGLFGVRLSRRFDGAVQQISKAVYVLTTLLMGYSLVSIAPTEIRRHLGAFHPSDAAPSQAAPALANGEVQPNIIDIVLDAYGRDDVLKARYQFDNGPFLAALEERGFYVVSKSRANFNLTPLCLSSMFQMDYPQNILTAADYANKDPDLFTEWIAHSNVRSFLTQRQYRFVVFDSGWSYTKIPDADELRGQSATFSPYEMALLDLTLFTPLARVLKLTSQDAYAVHRQRIRSALQDIPDVRDVEQPVFVFAHVICPHPPFSINANGADVRVPRRFSVHDGETFYKFGGTRKEYQKGYVAQVRFVNGKILQAIDQMRQKMVRPTVILIHGDHGPGKGLVWRNMKKTDLFERMNNLAAVYFPDEDYSNLYPTMTGVNYYRMIFNHLFHTDFAVLPDESYFSDWSYLYKYTLIPEDRLVK